MLFQNRTDAGRKLAQALTKYKGRHPVVLALPRGGVPVAAEVTARRKECATSNQGAAQLTSNGRNRARNGNFGTGDQGSKLPHFRERRPGSV
jgi:hypothetical protein